MSNNEKINIIANDILNGDTKKYDIDDFIWVLNIYNKMKNYDIVDNLLDKYINKNVKKVNDILDYLNNIKNELMFKIIIKYIINNDIDMNKKDLFIKGSLSLNINYINFLIFNINEYDDYILDAVVNICDKYYSVYNIDKATHTIKYLIEKSTIEKEYFVIELCKYKFNKYIYYKIFI